MKDALELNVYRTFSDGSRVLMGHVASDGDEIWYRFDQNYFLNFLAAATLKSSGGTFLN